MLSAKSLDEGTELVLATIFLLHSQTLTFEHVAKCPMDGYVESIHIDLFDPYFKVGASVPYYIYNIYAKLFHKNGTSQQMFDFLVKSPSTE